MTTAIRPTPPACRAWSWARPSTYAADANIQINNIPVSSGTNTFSNVVSGVTLTVSQVTTAPVEVTGAADTTAARIAIDAFVKAYNAINDQLNA